MPDIMTIGELEEIIKAAPNKSLHVVSDSGFCFSGAEIKEDKLELVENEDEYSVLKEDEDEE